MVVTLLIAVSMASANAQTHTKTKQHSWIDSLSKVFSKPAPKPKPKIARKKKSKPKSRPEHTDISFEVDSQWMANYRMLEVEWQYVIPEDDEIRFKNGNYIVPLVVYRHFQDMAVTPPRTTPPPD